ncbi:sensor histidine kinase [Anaerosacchariphilus polymeriproducens]|uniref:Oxygen sensor histidine kinase NreB n=1 Tax=Anaerosacchariphilus polymeriproducens TaxID=1812858 RepID=A0A371AVE6_9FIRM|nr:sensor histidine kinase [Anaerosacchariphilus polymeriproducens]RDU23554.1 two-component sensor histidine kinase [Anaerosacchariphilus polymeriproducens]
MVYDFLEKYKAELMLEIENSTKELTDLNLRLKESVYYLKSLEIVNDENYKAFSPRKIVNENENKINFYKSEIKRYKFLIQKKVEKIKSYENKLNELSSFFEFTKEKHKSESIKTKEEERIKILEVQEDERKRIARDLHDTVVQNLTHTIHKIELASKLVEIDPIRSKLELLKMESNVRDIVNEMRTVIYNLHPLSVDDLEIDVVVGHELNRVKEISDLNVQYKVEGDIVKVSPVVSITLFRIIQEACNNIVKHANANNVNVLLKYLANSIEMRIDDDGAGFDFNTGNTSYCDSNKSFGLVMMKERVSLLSGEISIESSLGEGTSIFIKIPKQ